MEVVWAIVVPFVNVLTVIKQKLGNLTSSADRVKEMKDKMKVLDGQRVDNENHMRRNHENNLKIPARVPGWLNEVEYIKKEVEKFASNDIGCFNVKKKYLAGRNALRVTKDIEGLIIDGSRIIWCDAEIPLGRVDLKRLASTSGGGTQNLFKSRYKTFNDALKLLLQDDDDAARVIALCGMGGVGKTTLMMQLKKAVHDNKMFDCIVVVTVGKSANLFAIQNAIAAHIGEPLPKSDEKLEPPTKIVEELRAVYLSKRFEGFLERKEKILVILDDVWEKIKVEDIGFAGPLPNGVKLLLTSRDVEVCRQIAYDAHSALEVVEVDVLEENEACAFFCQKAEISAEHDHDLYEIGCGIVKKCGYLPLAIELIAGTLKCEKDRGVWRYTRDRLKINDLDENVQGIIEKSYKSLKREEDKAIFLLCGLFPKDSNIPIGDLTRYAWGLKLLRQVSTMEAARESIKTSVSNLKKAYLLMDGDSHHSDCVKLHDLVLAFVVATVSKGDEEGCWIIHHDDFSKWSEEDNMSQSCKRISLTCKGVSEFPSEFKFPKLRFLKLVQGDESLMFPQGFYEGMKELQVIAFEKLKYPLVPTSFQCSANLRTLCLDQCSLMSDLTCIGDLSNLEVLSFANSGVTILPSTFGNLKKLRLLDVTGCDYDLVIEDGVLESLVKLEELYMIPYDEKACCCFTNNNSREFAERSENLRRFKLSVGCSSTEVREHVQTYKVDMHSYENSLKLVTNIEELLKSKINELFKITYALYLQVKDMNTLEDVQIPHPPRYSSFYNLRLLVVSQCAELKYLFTPSVATNLSKLEYLDISGCPNMEAVIHTENDGLDIIKFSNLKILKIQGCNLLEHVFTFSTLESLTQLEELEVKDCKAMEVIVKKEKGQQTTASDVVGFPHLKSLILVNLPNFVGFFLGKNEFIWPALEKVVIGECPQITVFTYGRSTTPKLSFINTSLGKHSVECGLNFHVTTISHQARLPSYESTSSYRPNTMERLPWSYHNLIEADMFSYNPSGGQTLFSSSKLLQLQKLETVRFGDCGDTKEIFDSQIGAEIPNLRQVALERLSSLKYIWKSKQGTILNFPSLTRLSIQFCGKLEYVFTCPMVGSLLKLQELHISYCDSMKVIVKGEEEEECDAIVNAVVFPCLKSLKLVGLDRLEGFCLGKETFEFPSLDTLQIDDCYQMTVFTKGDLSTPKLSKAICN